ncbi:MAG TPA: hypothetical protein VFQ85_09415 [Mycobacteriales bacterium]|jgi:hypothetical protein|nr:hypothetical protein [Mycobacteriales bacterium]
MMRRIVEGTRNAMVRRPGEDEPDAPGGHAADRLREFLDERIPGGEEPSETPPDPDDEPDDAASHSDSATGDTTMPDD